MIIIDYNAIAISNVVAMKLEVQEDLIRHMILNSIRSHRKRFKQQYGEVVIATDGMKNWRYQAFPQYKHKRKDARKDSDMDWQELFRITNLVLQEIDENFPWKVVRHEQCEADDIISQLVLNTQEFGQYEPVMIISGDKDFAQLQRFSNVAQYSPVQKKMIKEDNPRRQLQELILKGDQSDGVPNVLSGDNVFVDGIRQTPLRSRAIEQLLDNPKSLGEEVYRNYLRNKKLIDLTETPEQIKQEIINIYTSIGDKTDNSKKVMNYLIKKRCKQLIEVVGDFV